MPSRRLERQSGRTVPRRKVEPRRVHRSLALMATVLAVVLVTGCGDDGGSPEEATGGFETVEDANGGFAAADPPPTATAEPPDETESTEPPDAQETEASGEQGVVTAIGSTVPLGDVSRGEADFVVEFLEVELGDGRRIQAEVLQRERDRVTKLFLNDKLGEGSEVEVRSTDGDEWEFVDVLGE
jgi:hypothetical protein